MKDMAGIWKMGVFLSHASLGMGLAVLVELSLAGLDIYYSVGFTMGRTGRLNVSLSRFFFSI
jgi:hypothetical protein